VKGLQLRERELGRQRAQPLSVEEAIERRTRQPLQHLPLCVGNRREALRRE
jgi:hypothetical protein